MIRNCLVYLLLGAFAVIALPATTVATPYVLGELVIKMASGHEVQEIHNQFGTVPAQHLEQLDIHLINAGSSTDLDSLSALIETTGIVEFCQPNYRIDPLQPVQSSLPVSDELGEGSFADQTAATRLELSSAHQYATGSSIRVAVLDGGIDYTHPALAGVASSGYDYVTDDFDAMDEPGGPNSGHGTFVSGVVHLVAPSAEIRAYRVTDLNGESNGYQVAEAIMQAVNDSCRIINLSMVTMAEHAAMVDAIAYAAANDVLVVVAAGNGHDGGTAYPASDPNAFAVAAIDTTDQLADFSNYGDYVDICAPGTEIYSAYLDHGYAWWGGTSFAAPFVTAQAALLLDFNPEATRQDVIDAISATAEDIYDANGDYVGQLGAGLIDPLESLIAIRNGTVSISVPGDYPTIQEAVDAALIGDTVLVAPGVYDESVFMIQKLVHLIGRDGPGYTMLRPAGPGQKTLDINSVALGQVTVSGFSFGGSASIPTIDIYNSDVKMTNCYLANIDAGSNTSIVSVAKSSLDMSYCSFYQTTGLADIYFLPEHKWAELNIHNNTFHKNTRVLSISAADYPLDTLKISLVNNIFSTTYNEVVDLGRPIRRGAYNLFWNNEADFPPAYTDNFPNAVFADPLFVGADTAALWLQTGSPAIDAGDPDPMQNDPDGSRNDIGAFPVGEGYPAAIGLTVSGAQGGSVITHLTPTFTWTYQDIDSLPQQQVQLQVGTDNDWAVAEVWDSGPIAASNPTATYAGPVLTDISEYFVRLRVHNGAVWGPWFITRFYTSIVTLVRVPLDAPSINAGITRASSGDTVLVADGLWVESVHLPQYPILLTSENGAATTTIQDNLVCIWVDSTAIDSACVVRGFTLHADIDGVYIDHYGSLTLDSLILKHSRYQAIQAMRVGRLEITNCVFDSSEVAVDANYGVVSMRNNILRNIDDFTAVRLGNCDTAQLYDNLIHGVSGQYALYISQTNHLAMVNNTIANNDMDDGIYLYATATAFIHNNIIVSSGLTGIDNQSSTIGWDFGYNNVYGFEQNYGFIPDSLLVTSFELPPLFVDTAADDYSLLPGSPCIDAGHPDPAYNDPDGSRGDIGAIWVPQTITYPLPTQIMVSPVNAAGHVTDTIPQISWTYSDTSGLPQTQYQVQVGTDHDWTAIEIWDSGPVTSTSNSIVYAGPPLTPFHAYTVRVRLNNGSGWGSWLYQNFFIRLDATIRVPAHFSSITEAVVWAIEGDTILVAPGTYAEDVTVDRKSLIFLSEEGADSTILIPATPETESILAILDTRNAATLIRGFTLFGGQNGVYLDHSGLQFENNRVEGATSRGIYCRYPYTFLKVRHNEFSGNNQAMYIYSTSAPLTLDSNRFIGNGPKGAVTLSMGNGAAVVAGNLFVSNSSAGNLSAAGGIYLYDGTFTVHNNTFFDNGPGNSCIRALANVSNTDIRNNIFANAQETAVRISDSNVVTVAYNNIFGAGGYVGINPGEGDIFLDPLFADTANNDFTLLPGSPCIDAGDTSFTFMEPDFTRIDIGAFSTAYGASGLEVDTIGVIGEDATHIIDSLPTIAWQASGDYTAFEIQVGSDLIWGDSTDWLPGIVTATDTAIVYAGPPLQRAVDNLVRLRLFDGSSWGPWTGRIIRRNGLPALTASIPAGEWVGYDIVMETGNEPDPDGDSLACDFELFTDSLRTNLLASFYGIPGRVSPVVEGLTPLTRYWWRTRGFDGLEYTSWTPLRPFRTIDSGGTVTLDLPLTREIPCGQAVTFEFSILNDTPDTITAMQNGFRIWSPDGAAFEECTAEWIDSVHDYTTSFDFVNNVNIYRGGGEDTAAFFGLSLFTPGLPPGFGAPAYRLTTRSECTEQGRTLCIDKSLYGPSNTPWMWAFKQLYNQVVRSPAWGGPFCFTIEDCCIETRGDVNGDGTNANMTDLTYLIAFLFQGGPPPPCFAEANINADIAGDLSLTDVTMLVNSMFISFTPLPSCGEAKLVPPASLAGQSPVVLNTRYERDTTIITVSSTTELLGLHLRLVGGEGTTPRLLTDGPFSLFHNFEDDILTVGLLDINTGAALRAGSLDVISMAGRWEIADAFAADRQHRDIVATIGVADPLIPSHYELAQNYPNPFNPSTTIKFGLPVNTIVRLEIINILGQRVALLADREYEAGYHEIVWDGTSSSGQTAASGVYFYRLRANGFEQSKKMMLLK